ncbi:MAG: hypothetical protein ACREJC_07190, partial [Tepidisphaeraceae bacterium]
CHFFAKVDSGGVEVRVIDTARVRRLGLFVRRWIVKDLAQFWYSTMQLAISDSARADWLDRYSAFRGINIAPLRKLIQRKAAWIKHHDRKLNRAQPNRNISIPRDA